MVKYENLCVGCPQGCRDCGNKHAAVFICDDCGDESYPLHEFEGDQLCEYCVLKRLDKVEV